MSHHKIQKQNLIKDLELPQYHFLFPILTY